MNAEPVATRTSGPKKSRPHRFPLVVGAMSVGVASLLVVWSGFHPHGNFEASLLGLGALAVAALAWLWLLIQCIRRARFHPGLVALPLTLLLALGATRLGVVRNLGWELARPSLEHAVAEGTCPGWAGPLPVSRCVSLGDGGTAFHIRNDGFLVSGGWAHIADPKVAAELLTRSHLQNEGYRFKEIGDSWYLFEVVW
ncbi:hypothetical protein EII34_14075 [Arachnia propionica]|uniref:Uncharacterized protein n=1 Tax=Arachnia propionica TaxID=1750 RepID=A0A3P1T1S4_9ACTN|nr:hypothetical protein [Arachnia propionica]RRD03412.1 hypothetical protein EII34_14075 [Arachnia propionica]